MDRKRAIIIAASAAIILAAVSLPFLRADEVVIDVLDIGQGDAVLVRSGRTEMLIDGGPDRRVLSELGRAMPLFDRTIETVVVSHPHADHYRGMAAVMARYAVGTILVADSDGEGEYAEFLRTAAAKAPVVAARAGDRVRVGRATADVLWPVPPAVPATDPNAASVVIVLYAFGRPAAVLTGDATADVEHALSVRGLPSAPLLKVGHHGSGTSSTGEFLDAVRPEHAVISVGKNRYGHPATGTLLRLKAAGARVWRTDKDGPVRAVFTAAGYRIVGNP